MGDLFFGLFLRVSPPLDRWFLAASIRKWPHQFPYGNRYFGKGR